MENPSLSSWVCAYACVIPILLFSPEKRNIDELRDDSDDHETPSTLERIHLLPKVEKELT